MYNSVFTIKFKARLLSSFVVVQQLTLESLSLCVIVLSINSVTVNVCAYDFDT